MTELAVASRVLELDDDLTGSHQPCLAQSPEVFNPLVLFFWDGLNIVQVCCCKLKHQTLVCLIGLVLVRLLVNSEAVHHWCKHFVTELLSLQIIISLFTFYTVFQYFLKEGCISMPQKIGDMSKNVFIQLNSCCMIDPCDQKLRLTPKYRAINVISFLFLIICNRLN